MATLGECIALQNGSIVQHFTSNGNSVSYFIFHTWLSLLVGYFYSNKGPLVWDFHAYGLMSLDREGGLDSEAAGSISIFKGSMDKVFCFFVLQGEKWEPQVGLEGGL